MQEALPKKIWFLWLQGFSQMPPIVKACYASWQRHHPIWEVIFLHKGNLDQYLDVRTLLADRPVPLYRVSQSDIIRINLLQRYGGVWVDATCYCRQPMEEWLLPGLQSGFFAFDRPGADRMLSTWLMAALPENELVNLFCGAVNQFWSENKNLRMWHDRPLLHKILRRTRLARLLKKHPGWWYHPLWVKGFKIYHYYWFHYLFEKLYREHHQVRRIWDQTPKISADGPHKIFYSGITKPLSPALKKDLAERVDPVYKLTYKYKAEDLHPEAALFYFLNEAP
jgi:hypothetical protein